MNQPLESGQMISGSFQEIKMSPGNHLESKLFLGKQVNRCFYPCQSSMGTFVLAIDPDAGISIRAYVLNGSHGCIFSKWRKSAATNRNSVEYEAERETLPFSLVLNQR